MYHLLHPVYVVVEPLAPACQPAEVVRKHGMTLIFFHVGALRAELAFWCQENLTDPERQTLREAYRCSPDLRLPPNDAVLDGCADPVVPPALRLPDAAYASSA